MEKQGIGFFERNLTLWVLGCMIIGVLIGVYLPQFPEFLSRFEVASVSIPVAVLIWLMISRDAEGRFCQCPPRR
ncbi:MAG: hypothetical protein U5L46_03260 [Agrobacterium sp.]|nr:hypothetical protein [Agrobacterium sp.]